MNELVYGKNDLQRIVCIEPQEGQAEIFVEHEDGSIGQYMVPNSNYILFARRLSPKMRELKGNQPYRFLIEYDSRARWTEVLKAAYQKRLDFHVIRDPKEALMVKDGYTYFKGMKVEDVSVMSIDIETNGLKFDENSKVLTIACASRKKGKLTKRLFSLDEYRSVSGMLMDFCVHVLAEDPSVIIGHNLFGFDLPYLAHVAELNEVKLDIGRDRSEIKFADRTSQFRKDGSQSYDYTNAHIYGREIVDTFFLALKYDIGRNYESYRLKDIIRQEGLEKKGRTHYDAANIAKDWEDPKKRELIKKYNLDDVDDALKLYDLMIPSFFYYTQSIPRSFQQIINSATGSQINSLMCRAYLQQGHGLARGSDKAEYEGAISFGIPGVHKNVLRFDVASLYPSIIRQFRITDKDKDPQGLLLKLVDYFTLERLENKRKGKETGDRYYKDLEQSQKIAINSMYGFMGAPKLNYNYPDGAAQVTREGRNVLKAAILKLTGKPYEAHGLDTGADVEESSGESFE